MFGVTLCIVLIMVFLRQEKRLVLLASKTWGNIINTKDAYLRQICNSKGYYRKPATS